MKNKKNFADKLAINVGVTGTNGVVTDYMTTAEAAQYLRRSQSWLLRQPEIPYVRGVPNIYKKSDLDDWFERNKFKPKV